MVVGCDMFYLYGGMMEVGEWEVILDDLYIMDLNKLDVWNLVIEVVVLDLFLIFFCGVVVFLLYVIVKLYFVKCNVGLICRY